MLTWIIYVIDFDIEMLYASPQGIVIHLNSVMYGMHWTNRRRVGVFSSAAMLQNLPLMYAGLIAPIIGLKVFVWMFKLY